jgi:signal transduction histidine kinase/CheY-like chemotaxis protein/HPt (histidine-containing phosphotransfer) domain-containing protein
MALDSSDLATRVVAHLLEMGYGECSITHEMIAGYEGDVATCEILTGLMFLHEDLKLRNEQRELAERELHRAIADLEEKNATAQRLAVELRAAKEEAEAATIAKSRFLAHMSHEIRTPLTALLGFTDLLIEGELDEATRRDYNLVVRRNGEHLLSLINNILDLSKIEAGELLIERMDFSLPQIIADVVSLMRVRATNKALDFDVRLLSPIPARVETDPTRLRQILLNLLSNAIKFTHQGSVQLTVRYLARPVPMLLFDVVDTGIGMNAEQLERLFQPFQQADASMSRRFGGSGLGLAICKLLAEALGGDIVAQGSPGEGSTFTLSLVVGVRDGVPTVRSLAERNEPTESEQEVGRLSGRVLLAEDGPDNQMLISTVLRARGLSVTVAENGRVAMETALAAAAHHRPFDVILMDMQMPEMDGYAATDALRKAGYRHPILALTAHAMAGERERCIEVGCDEYLSKPIDRRALVAAIAHYLGGGAVSRERGGWVEPSADSSTTQPASGADAPVRSTLSDDPEIGDLIGRFVTKMPGYADSLEAAAGDHDELRSLTHQLKGAAGGYGFTIISEAAGALEAELRTSQPSTDRVRDHLDALIGLCRRVRS